MKAKPTVIIADIRQDELMAPISGVAGESILHLVFGQIERALVAELFSVRLAHQHDFVEEEHVTIPLTRVLIFVSFDAQNAVALKRDDKR